VIEADLMQQLTWAYWTAVPAMLSWSSVIKTTEAYGARTTKALRLGTHKVGHDYLLLPRDLGGLVPQRKAQV
jgi:hypothetical protein